MSTNIKQLEKLTSEVKIAVDLINQHHIGANLNEAKSFLKEVGESIKKDDGARAMELVMKAQLAAKPTTEYLLSSAKKITDDGSEAYEKEDFSEAIKLWESSLEIYTRVIEVASERREVDIVDALKPTIASIEEDIKTATVNRARREMVALDDEADKIDEKAKKLFDKEDFDAAREEFKSAKTIYTKAKVIAGKFGFEDEHEINREIAAMETSIEACLLHKGDTLIKQANIKKAKEKENALSEVIKYLESFSSNNPIYNELKAAAHKGLIEGRIDIGTKIMEDAEEIFNKKEYYKAKEEYTNAKKYFEDMSDFAAEHRLKEEERIIDNSIEACKTNIRLCVDTLVSKRDAVAKPVVVKIADLKTGITPDIKIKKAQPIFSFPEELLEYYFQPEFIGEGGNSWVYRVQRKKDEMIAAIKIAKHRDRKAGTSFIDEIQIWRDLDHKNIAKIYSYSAFPIPHIEMELLAGSVEDMDKPINPRKAGHLIFKIADGLRYAHGRPSPVFHLDLKPGNIMLAADEEPKIVDWGLSKMMRLSKQSTGEAKGWTTLYATPEHISGGKVDARTDIFQLGQIFYELVTGKPPFEADTDSAIIKKIESENPPLPSTINHQAKFLEPIIMRCLEKEKEKRYQSIEDFHNELAKVLEIEQIHQVKITHDRMEKIMNYCEMIEVYLRDAINSSRNRDKRVSALNKCIDRLESLTGIVKTSETKDLINYIITDLNYCIEHDIDLHSRERLDDMNRILDKARRQA